MIPIGSRNRLGQACDGACPFFVSITIFEKKNNFKFLIYSALRFLFSFYHFMLL